jgi:drug/metabolite transporter (DMT)-like permease
MKLTKKAALLILVITALLWSTSGMLIKSINWNPLAIASVRALIAGITIFCLLPKVRIRDFTRVHAFAALSYAFLSISFIAAMKLTTVANTLALQFTAPIWVALLAPIFLKEKTGLIDWIFMGVIFCGVLLFFQGGLSRHGFWGNILALVSGFFFGSQALCLRSIKHNSPALAIVFGNILTFVLCVFFISAPYPDLKGILMLVALGVFQMGLSYFLYIIAVPYVSSLELVVITMVEPILSPVWAFLIVGERPSGFAVIGAIIVIFSVFIWSMMKLKTEKLAPISES